MKLQHLSWVYKVVIPNLTTGDVENFHIVRPELFDGARVVTPKSRCQDLANGNWVVINC
jgi:hypothetical protein